MGMSYLDIYEKVKAGFEQSGIVFDPADEDPVLDEYIENSIQYISSIVAVENALDIEVPDEYLIPQNMHTLSAFSKMLMEIIKNKNDAIDQRDDG